MSSEIGCGSAPPAHQTRGRGARLAGGVPWILLALFVLQFALTFRPDALTWDGAFYYAYARSIVFDGDLNLGNDLVLSYEVTPGEDFASQRFDRSITPAGRVANPFGIGTALLWLPWYAVVAGLVRIGSAVGLELGTPPGFELPLKWGMATVTAVYGFVAVVVAYRFARHHTGRWPALLASATLMFTTPLVYYQFREPFFAHAASAMVVALFVTYWWHSMESANSIATSAFLLGALGGAAALVRTQNITYLILPLLSAVSAAWPGLRDRNWRAVGRPAFQLVLTGIGALLVLTVQFAVWRVLYGQWVTVPQGQSFLDWRAPWVRPVLFSSFNGLVPWMPLIIPALAGLVFAARHKPNLGVPLLVALGLQVYVNSTVGDWFAGGGYGPRRFSSTLILVAVGYATLLGLRRDWWYRSLGVAVSVGLMLHQWLILAYGFDDKVGGHVVSMETPPQWDAAGLDRLTLRLASYLPLVVRDPVRTIVLADSPLAKASESLVLFAGKFVPLGGVLAGIFVLQLVARRAGTIDKPPRFARWLVPLGVAGGVLLVDWWLLTAA